jgi:hypothetical protein
MSVYPEPQYSMKAVRKAGEKLAGSLVLYDGMPDAERSDILNTFAVANSWRDSYVYPMRSVRLSVLHRMRQLGIGGITAARPKRMSSIRKKAFSISREA